MKFFLASTIISTLLLSQTTAELVQFVSKPCATNDKSFKYLNRQISFVPVTPNTKGVTRVTGGTMVATNGCTFVITDFTLIPTGGATYFYGIPKGQPDVQNYFPRIVAPVLGNYNGQTISFTMSTASWTDMDGIAIYSEDDKAVYMKALWVDDVDDSNDADSTRVHALTVALISSCMALKLIVL